MSNKWIIKDALDHVHGPYETEEILGQIENGTLTGDEFISSYPEGSWKQISTEPEFFDHMLAALTGSPIPKKKKSTAQDSAVVDPTIQLDDSEHPENEEKKDDSVEDEKIDDSFVDPEELDDVSEIRFGDEDDENEFEQVSKTKALEPVQERKVYREVKGRSHLFEDRQALTLGEQADLKRKIKKREQANRLLYLVFVLAIGLLLSYFFIEDEVGIEDQDNKVVYRLRLPEQAKTQFKVTDLKTKEEALVRSIRALAFDEPKKTILALDFLNSILQSEPRNERGLLLTCNSNFQIWPHTRKDSRDLYVVSELAKRTYASGVTGDALSTCRVVEKILYKNTDDASRIVDSYLNAEDASGTLSFYLRYYKAYLLYKEKDYTNASSFAESSVKLEPSWIPSLILLGEIYIKLNQSQNAANVFARVLKINPRHFEAIAYIAYLQFEYFSKPKVGLKFFNKAEQILEKRDFYNKSIYSQVLSSIAKAYLKSGRREKAKEFGQRAFNEDPSNIQAKNILISTGSKTNVDKADKLFMAEADQLFQEQEWKASIALYEQAYLINKKNGFAALRISKAYWEQSFVKEAIRWAELSIAAEPKRLESYIALSEYLINQYELIQASRVLSRALRISNRSFEVFRGLAKIEYLRKNYPRAEAYARRALKMYSNDSESILLLSKIIEAMGDIEKAYAHAKAAMEVTEPSFELENYFCLLLMKTQGFTSALDYLSKREDDSGGSLMYGVIRSNMYFEDEQYKKAYDISKKVYSLLEGGTVNVVLAYARALGALDQIDASLDQYQKAFLMDPTDPSPLFKSATLLLDNKQPEGAIEQIKRVQRVTPKYPELYYYWAKALKEMGTSKSDKETLLEAIKTAEQEIERNPTYVDSYLLIADAYYILGGVLLKQAKKLSSNSPNYSEVYSEMISWYKLCSRSYQKAMDLALQPGQAYISLARCQRLSGQVDLAVVSARKAGELDTSNPLIWIETALIYEQEGNQRAALKAYEKYLLIFPNAPNKEEVLGKIKKLEELSGGE